MSGVPENIPLGLWPHLLPDGETTLDIEETERYTQDAGFVMSVCDMFYFMLNSSDIICHVYVFILPA